MVKGNIQLAARLWAGAAKNEHTQITRTFQPARNLDDLMANAQPAHLEGLCYQSQNNS